MKRVRRKPQNETLWFISYSDLITAILAVLIIIMSFSKLDIEKIDHVNRLMKDDELVTLSKLKTQYEDVIKQNNLSKLVNMKLDEEGLSINTSASVQFPINSAELNNQGIKKLIPIFKKVVDDSKKRQIYIIGHTDDIGTNIRNWQLSSQRANSILVYLIKSGVNSENVTLKAYGSNKPYQKITKSLSQNEKKKYRAMNRRVTILIGRSYE